MMEDVLPEETGAKRETDYKVGPGKPPIEHQFKSGGPGGPGRPPGDTLTSMLRRLRDCKELAGVPLPGDRTAGELASEVAWTRAIKGDFRFYQEIMNRLDGKVPDKVQVDDMRKSYDVENTPDEL